jgi:3-hydroxyacyl-[acyl-carrier-protein] dehydratase
MIASPPGKEFRCELPIAADHGSYAGHFPEFPVLPGAVLLDEALHEIARSRDLDLAQWQVAAVKFLNTVRPGDALTLEHSAPDGATIRFTIRTAGARIATGTLCALAAIPDEPHGA